MYWKCENKDCKGRGNPPAGLIPHLTITQGHDMWHEPLLVKREVVETLNNIVFNIIKNAIKDKLSIDVKINAHIIANSMSDSFKLTNDLENSLMRLANSSLN